MGNGIENDTNDIRLSREDINDEQNEILAVSKKKMKEMISSWGGNGSGDVPSWNDNGELGEKSDTGTLSFKKDQKEKEESDHFSSSDDDDDDEEEEGDEEEEEEEGDTLNVDALSYREVQAELKKRGEKVKGKKVQLVKTLKDLVAAEKPKKVKTQKKQLEEEEKEEDEKEESNPWLAKKSESSTSKKRKRGQKDEHTLHVEAALSAYNNKDKYQDEVKSDEQIDRTSTTETSTTNKKVKEIKGKSQRELVQMAFAVDDDVEAEFAKEKNMLSGEELNGGKKSEPVLVGWGSWTGFGAKAPQKKKQKKKILKNGSTTGGRRDKHLKHVIISEKRNKRAAKYLVPTLPHQYDSKQQYERSLRNPIGPEWNTSDAHARMTRPKVIARGGNVIAPIKMPKQYKRKLVSINAEFSALQKAKRAKRDRSRASKF